MGKLQRETVSEPDPLQLPAAQRTGSACQATRMKRILLASLLLLLALAYGLHLLWPHLAGGVPEGEPAAMDAALGQRASAFLNALEAGQFALAHESFEPRMQEALPEAKLREIWQTLPRQLGPLRSRGEPRMETIQGTAVVVTPLHFERFNLDARIAFDASARISGFYLVPARRAPEPPGSGERELLIGEAASALPGTLRLPDAPGAVPLVVLVHGSGPHDRDETIGPNRPFRELAEGLARKGVATLRYEKRSRQHPQAFAARDYTVDLETVDDAVRAVELAQSLPGVDPDRVFVLGHSLGAMMAPRIAERAPGVAGLILLAAPARPLHTLALEQHRYLARLDPDADANSAHALAETERAVLAIERLDPSIPANQPLLLGLPAAYWRDLEGYDPVAKAQTLGLPLFVAHGGRDHHVDEINDFGRWRLAFKDDRHNRFVVYPEANHLFQQGSGPSRPEEYFLAAEFEPLLARDIADWIGKLQP